MKCVLLVLIVLTIKFDQGMTDFQPDISDPFNTVLIAGGKVANVRDFPYMVVLVGKHINDTKRFFNYCGGSILTPRHILTAAHCAEELDSRDFKVMIGVTKLNSIEKLKKYDVHAYFLHPERGSEKNNKTKPNDIAIVVLQDPLEMRQEGYVAKTVSLPNRSYVGKTAIFSGYGGVADGKRSEVLRSIKLPVISNEQCQEIFHRDRTIEIDASMLCAGFVNKNKGTMLFDSGGPLVIREGRDKFTQIGVLSGGDKLAKYPNIFSDVLYSSKWIKDIISKY
ncbi:venom peptide isomerase heavy chain-like [Brevipalpus obovatus]|uniref:venom peptide isomerase heavy chain-like n=1 Tax=Brevipalpus obovatus TaxID=246614 RepID=UPI003D9E7ED3